MLFDMVLEAAQPKVQKRIWILSDLQQAYADNATYCMTRAVSDFLSLRRPVDAVCYLGDAVERHMMDHLAAMTEMQERELAKVQAPVYYVPGNHDFDYYSYFSHIGQPLEHMEMPFFDRIRQNPQWHTQQQLADLCFIADLGKFALCFLPDHADPDGKWYTTHGEVRKGKEEYPYTEADYRAVMERVKALRKPVITLSHYSYPGGNREAPLFQRFLPLPENVRMHFYGHAHIGDAQWAGKDCHRKICEVNDQPVMQINVASLENFRGSAIRSVIMEWYEDEEIGICFRNHSLRCWDDYLLVRKGDGRRSEERD